MRGVHGQSSGWICGNDDRKTRDERKGYQRERENPKHAVFEVGA